MDFVLLIFFQFFAFQMIRILSIIKLTVNLLLSLDSSVVNFLFYQFFRHYYFLFALALRITLRFKWFLANTIWRSVLWNHETVIFFCLNCLIVWFELLRFLLLPNLCTKFNNSLIFFHFILRDKISWCTLPCCHRFMHADGNVSGCSFNTKKLIGRFCFAF